MLKLNKKVDYGIIVLVHLVRARGVVSASGVADGYGLSRPLVANILKDLARAGIVRATRGAKGGYALTRPPEAITLAAVVRAIDGEFTLTECTSPGGDGTNPTSCDIAPACPVRVPLQVVHDRIAEVLERLTFAEIACRPGSARDASSGPVAALPARPAH